MLNGVSKIQNFKLLTNVEMTCVMLSPWKRTFTLAPLVHFIVISPIRLTPLNSKFWLNIQTHTSSHESSFY